MAKKRGNNEGSIHKREDGSWRAQVTIDGKRLSFSSKSYNECRAWVQSTQHQIETGLTYDKAQITIFLTRNQWNFYSKLIDTIR